MFTSANEVGGGYVFIGVG